VDLSSFIVSVFCLIDDRIEELGRLRARGPLPKLSDAEVLTIELVGEFLGLDTDEAIFRYFREHYGQWFPALLEVHRTTSFARQSANLRKVKEGVWRELLSSAPHDPAFALCDSMPLPACLFAEPTPLPALPRGGGRLRQRHAPRADLLRLQGAREGLLAGAHHPFVGGPGQRPRTSRAPRTSRVHLRSGRRGPQPPLAQDRGGVGVHGRRASGPVSSSSSSKKLDPNPERIAFLSRVRYRIDTVFSQLVERYRIKRVWARDLWHLTSRLLRKVLSHTVAFLLNHRMGNQPLQLAKLLH
jgi:hypothetical protein